MPLNRHTLKSQDSLKKAVEKRRRVNNKNFFITNRIN